VYTVDQLFVFVLAIHFSSSHRRLLLFQVTDDVAVYVQIEDQLQFDSKRNQCLTPMNQLLLTLRFYATGTFQLVVGDTFKIHKATVCRTVHRVTRAIASLRSKYVRFPKTTQEKHDIMHAFFKSSKMPGVLGAIDCTHVPIQSPGGDDAEIYRNRKGYFSLNVQLVCDKQHYITDVVARWPGSVHDSTIFDNCRLRAELETQRMDGYLVGDGGYPCRRYLLTPVVNPTTDAERAFNTAQTSARNCIERTNGILKRRFPALKYGIRLHITNVLPVIVATVVLHNIAVTLGDEEPPDDEQLHSFVASNRLQSLRLTYNEVQVVPPVGVQQAGATSMRQAVINGHFAS
jgi:nuclease HARBI1